MDSTYSGTMEKSVIICKDLFQIKLFCLPKKNIVSVLAYFYV